MHSWLYISIVHIMVQLKKITSFVDTGFLLRGIPFFDLLLELVSVMTKLQNKAIFFVFPFQEMKKGSFENFLLSY